MAANLKGKTALVTGGGSGIGRSASIAFAREGCKVVIADVDVKGGEETVGMVLDGGGEALFVRADVSKTAEVELMVMKAVEAFGGLDCALNNAGIAGSSALTHEYPVDVWDRVINTNLKGVWLCMKYEIPQMLSRGHGAVVNVSSIYGLVSPSGMSAYVASKHGVAGLTKTAAIEYARRGIRVNAVCPGAINTPMTHQDTDPATLDAEMSMHAIGRFGEPEEIAEAAVWLCSDASSFVTGHTLLVDGGYVAQ